LKAPGMHIILTIAVAAATLASMTVPAAAISRYNTSNMSCNAIRNVLARDHAAILRYPSQHPPGMTLYDRYVSSGRYCFPHQIPERATVPSRDGECPVLHCIAEPDLCDTFGAGGICLD
jgi:hypothetical protein